MITRLELGNFKAVGDAAVRLSLAPVTLLVGANGSGKSSVLDALGVLAETAATENQFGLVVSGDRVVFPSVEQVFHRCDSDRAMRLGASVDATSKGETIGFELVARRDRSDFGRWYCAQTLFLIESGRGAEPAIVATCHRSRLGKNSPQDVVEFPRIQWRGVCSGVDRLVNANAFQPSDTAGDQRVHDAASLARLMMAEFCNSLATKLVFISGLRGAELFMREVGPAAVRTGRFGQESIRLMSIVKADAKRRAAWDRISRWADVFGMPGLTGGWVGQNELVASFLDPGTDSQLPLSSAAGGSQRILPLLIDAFASPTPRTIVVDEIDAGLHPEWQVRLADLLADVVSVGNQVLATTHSPTTVLAVCAAVAAGKLKPEDVAIYGFERTDEVRATRLPVTRSGAIEGGWIESFAKVESQLLGSFLRGKEPEETAAVGPPEGRRRRGGHGRVSESPPGTAPPVSERKSPAKRRRGSRR